MVLLGKADGVDLTWDEILALPEDEGEPMTEFLGVALAPPGESASTLATLEAGDYAMVCFLPLGGRGGRTAPFHPGDGPRVHGRVARPHLSEEGHRGMPRWPSSRAAGGRLPSGCWQNGSVTVVPLSPHARHEEPVADAGSDQVVRPGIG